MHLHPLQHSDLDFIKELQPAGWGDILPLHEYYLKSSFCYPVKLRINNTDVGIGTSIIHPEVAWLAHIIVHPDHRNKGIGKQITQALLEQVKTTNCKTISLLSTDMGEPVYRKLGFLTETEYYFFKDGNINPEEKLNPNICLFNEKYKEQLFKLDREVAGENRTIRLEDHLRNSFLFVENNTVEGYFLPGLGEGLIVSRNPEAGIELMKVRLAKNTIAVLPQDNDLAIEFLQQNNFKEYRTAKRMWLGKKRTWHPKNIYNRISGQIG